MISNAANSGKASLVQTNSATGLSIVPIGETDPNLDDRYSVVSDSAAWSTDLINNSDSDLESNSPSKYTPYSTYSSNSSHTNTHPSIINNANLAGSDFASAAGTNSFNSATLTQSSSVFLSNQNANNSTIASNSSANDLIVRFLLLLSASWNRLILNLNGSFSCFRRPVSKVWTRG